MKSNICKLTEGKPFSQDLLNEVEKCARYNNLDHASTLRLSLLAEELVGMIPNMVEGYSGSFWIENDGMEYQLCAELKTKRSDFDTNEDLLDFSSSGKNAAAKGIVGKIRSAIELMMSSFDSDVYSRNTFISEGLVGFESYAYSWSLNRYIDTVKRDAAQEEAWDELEKSVISKLADDVVVEIQGKKILISVKKKF